MVLDTVKEEYWGADGEDLVQATYDTRYRVQKRGGGRCIQEGGGRPVAPKYLYMVMTLACGSIRAMALLSVSFATLACLNDTPLFISHRKKVCLAGS